MSRTVTKAQESPDSGGFSNLDDEEQDDDKRKRGSFSRLIRLWLFIGVVFGVIALLTYLFVGNFLENKDPLFVTAFGQHSRTGDTVVFEIQWSSAAAGQDVSDFTVITTGTAAASISHIINRQRRKFTQIVVGDISGIGTVDVAILGTNNIRKIRNENPLELTSAPLDLPSGDPADVDGTPFGVGSVSTIDVNPTTTEFRTTQLAYEVFFTKDIAQGSSVSVDDFALTTTDMPVGGDVRGEVLSATIDPSDRSRVLVIVHRVRYSGGLRLDVLARGTIADEYGNTFGLEDGSSAPFILGEQYDVFNDPPEVISSKRHPQDPSLTSGSTVRFVVTFSRPMYAAAGRQLSEAFSLDARQGASGTIGSIVFDQALTTAVVTVGNIEGSGTLQMDVVDDDILEDELGVPLGGLGSTNGQFLLLGERFTIDRSGPKVRSITLTDPVNRSTVNPFTPPFTITSFPTATSIAPGASEDIDIEFQPDSTGEVFPEQVRLNIHSTDVAGGVRSVPLRGSGRLFPAPQLSVVQERSGVPTDLVRLPEPAQTPILDIVGDVQGTLLQNPIHDFGPIPIGQADFIDVTLLNVGDEDLDVTGVTVSAVQYDLSGGHVDFETDFPDTYDVDDPLVLPGRNQTATLVLRITFAPTGSGSARFLRRLAEVKIFTSDPAISGGVFSFQVAGTRETSVAVSTDQTSFTDLTALPPPDAQQVLDESGTPRENGTLFENPSFDFGWVTTEDQKSFTLTLHNKGTLEDIVIRSVDIETVEGDLTEAELDDWQNDPDFWTDFGSTEVTLSPLSTHTVLVTFAPTATTPLNMRRLANVIVNFNDSQLVGPQPPFHFQIAGSRQATQSGRLEFDVMNDSLLGKTVDFGDVTTGTTHTQTVAVRNTGDGDLVIMSALSPTSPASGPLTYTFPSGTPSTVTMAPGDSLVLTVTVTPQAVGAATPETFRVESDDIRDGTGFAEITVTVTGIAPSSGPIMTVTTVQPESVVYDDGVAGSFSVVEEADFGDTTVAPALARLVTVRVTNTGDAPLNIGPPTLSDAGLYASFPSPLFFQVEFSEAVVGMTTADFEVEIVEEAGSAVTGVTKSFTLLNGDETALVRVDGDFSDADALVSIEVIERAGGMEDQFGFPFESDIFSTSLGYRILTTPFEIISFEMTGGDYVANTIFIKITCNRETDLFVADQDLVLTKTATMGSIAGISGELENIQRVDNRTAITAEITGAEAITNFSGTLTLTFANGSGITDIAGNPLVVRAGVPSSLSFAVPLVEPSVTVTSFESINTSLTNNTVLMQMQLSRPVTENFTATHFSLTLTSGAAATIGNITTGSNKDKVSVIVSMFLGSGTVRLNFTNDGNIVDDEGGVLANNVSEDMIVDASNIVE